MPPKVGGNYLNIVLGNGNNNLNWTTHYNPAVETQIMSPDSLGSATPCARSTAASASSATPAPTPAPTDPVSFHTKQTYVAKRQRVGEAGHWPRATGHGPWAMVFLLLS